MKKILNGISVIDSPTKFILFFVFIYMIVFSILYVILKRNKKVWKMLSVLPFAVFIVFMVFNYTRGNFLYWVARYLWIGLGALFICLFCVAQKDDKKHIRLTILNYVCTGVCLLCSLFCIFIMPGKACVGNYTHKGKAESLEGTIDQLEKSYVLRDWKNIDFDSLRAELIPRAQKAEAENNEVEFARTVLELVYNMFDGHIRLEINDPDVYSELNEQLAGNDYGFSLFRADDGQCIAVLVNKESDAAYDGIHNGTVITRWDGQEIDEAVSDVRCVDLAYRYPVAENEERFKPVYLAGKGGDTVSVTFINDKGQEQTAQVKKSGCYLSRKNNAVGKILSSEKTLDRNFSAKMLDDKCGYLRVSDEEYDDLKDVMAYVTGSYPEVREMFSDKLKGLEDQGMDRLIIDIRNNPGGVEEISFELASLFSDGNLAKYEGKYYKGKFKIDSVNKLNQSGRWCNIPVVVLVNARTSSSGDCLAYYLSECPNVTIMGITDTWGSAQETGGICMLSNDDYELYFPVMPTLDKNGDPLIDADSQRKAYFALDCRIPMTKDFMLKIFSDQKNDYELEYAMDYISNR